MKHLRLALIIFGLLIAPASGGLSLPAHTLAAAVAQRNDTVYITKSGRKYHRWGCRYLRSSCIPVKRNDAIANGYTPCSVCGG